MSDKKYYILLGLDERDAFHFSQNRLTDYSPLIGRVFEVSLELQYEDSPWIMFTGQLVGESLGSFDDGYYIFAYAKVEEVSNPTLM